MKQKNRIWIYSLIVMGFLLMLTTSCEKDEDLADYASEIVGSYIGTVNYVGTGSVSCTSKLTKSSNQEVDLEIIIASESMSLDGIEVNSSGGGIYILIYTDYSGSFTGSVQGNILTWTMSADNETLNFNGTK